jgi:hypothetical protein
MSSLELIIVPTPSRRAVSSVAQVSSLNVGWSRRVPRNRKGQSRRALSLLQGTDGSNPAPSSAESETNPGPDCRARARKPRNLRHRDYDAAAPSARADQTGGGWPRSDECDALANQKIPTNAWNTILSPARNALREARHGSGHVMDRVDAPGGSFGTKTPCSILICVSGPVPSGGFGTIRPRK